MNRSVDLIDRSDMIKKLNKNLEISPEQTAIITIDMHRGHLDPEVATMPCTEKDCEKVIKNSVKLLGFAREKNIPIIHVVMTHRNKNGKSLEGQNVIFWKELNKVKCSLTPGNPSKTDKHNLKGSIQTEIIPDLYDESDYIIDNKKRLSVFYGTDLEILLRVLNIKTLVLIGINTNTCVQCSAFESFNRDFITVVISDCVASMYGEDLHILGLQNISRCLGWVLNIEEFKEKI